MLAFVLTTLSTLFVLGLATGAISAHILAPILPQAGTATAALVLLVVAGFLTVAVLLVLILLLALIAPKRSALLKVTCAASLFILLPLWVAGAVLAQLRLDQLSPLHVAHELVLAAKATAWTSTGWTVITFGVSLFALRRAKDSGSPALSDIECFTGPTAQQADKPDRAPSRAEQQSIRSPSRMGQQSIRSPSRLGQSSVRSPSRLGQNPTFLPSSSRWSRPDLSRGIEHIAKHTCRQSRQHGRSSARSSASGDDDSINDDDWEFIDHGPSFAGLPRPAPVPPASTDRRPSTSPSPIPGVPHVGDTPVTPLPKSRRIRSLPPNPNPAPSIPLPLTPPDSVVSRGVGKQQSGNFSLRQQTSGSLSLRQQASGSFLPSDTSDRDADSILRWPKRIFHHERSPEANPQMQAQPQGGDAPSSPVIIPY